MAAVSPSAFLVAPALSEAAVLGACGSVILVVDATEEAPFAEAVDALRRTAAVLMALAARRQVPGGGNVPSVAALPALEVFVHKVSACAEGCGPQGECMRALESLCWGPTLSTPPLLGLRRRLTATAAAGAARRAAVAAATRAGLSCCGRSASSS